MRKLVYMLVFGGVVLGVVNLTLTNSLASEGEFLKSISREKDTTLEEISRFHKASMEAQSLTRIEARAQELGFIEPIHQVHLKSDMLAVKNSEE